jgi:hypothetical protein
MSSLDLEPHSDLDKSLRLGALVVLAFWNVLIATRMETPYPEVLVELYALPAARLVLLALVVASTFWCPTIATMLALAFITLGADVIFLTK